MGLFRRKQLNEEDDERCPNCRGRLHDVRARARASSRCRSWLGGETSNPLTISQTAASHERKPGKGRTTISLVGLAHRLVGRWPPRGTYGCPMSWPPLTRTGLPQ
jgi:hypothetical protein